ncbi:hypothetical protein [Curtobacterium sp. MCSS17_016]|uniref:hypothetical protein n=1 Tax=Curtobacterium sp. MCSS17_016 TaxID=2175644 RepID=UPI000DAA9A96|nr:hypothetical protein [Curtobacterium sp. MCSS17_016]WIE81409.1 hypothetical protein DEJ19_019430 [Curtobacterium sp. MCSS17_016]
MTDGVAPGTVTLTTRVRVLRERMYPTVEEAAEHGGLTGERWRAIEAGARPTAGECLSLSWALGVSLDVIRGRGITADASDEADVHIAAILDVAARLQDDGLLPASSSSRRA